MSKQLSARQLAVKVIHEDKENVTNPSIMAKYMREYTNDKLNDIIKELEEKRDEEIDTGPFGHLKENCVYMGALNKAIKIVKLEITKKD